MSLYNAVTRHVLAPTFDLVRGTHTMRRLAELEQSQWLPRERIEELQAERLASLPVMQYQVVQEDLDTVIMYLVPTAVPSPEELAALREKVRDMFAGAFGESIRLDVQFTDRITPGTAGKHTFVFSKVDPVAPTWPPEAAASDSGLSAH